MKIVATVIDVDSVVYCGGHAESRSAIIDIPESLLPSLVLEHLANQKLAKEDKSYKTYNNLTFSILEEDQLKESQ